MLYLLAARQQGPELWALANAHRALVLKAFSGGRVRCVLEGGGSSQQVLCIQDDLSLILKCGIVFRINYGNKKKSQVAYKEITLFKNKQYSQGRTRGTLATSPEMLVGEQGQEKGVIFQNKVLPPLSSAT